METKTNQVRDYLEEHGSITSWDAIKLFKAIRLSSIIFDLRKKGHLIESEWQTSIDENGRVSRYVKYNLIKKEDHIENNMNHIPSID